MQQLCGKRSLYKSSSVKPDTPWQNISFNVVPKEVAEELRYYIWSTGRRSNFIAVAMMMQWLSSSETRRVAWIRKASKRIAKIKRARKRLLKSKRAEKKKLKRKATLLEYRHKRKILETVIKAKRLGDGFQPTEEEASLLREAKEYADKGISLQ